MREQDSNTNSLKFNLFLHSGPASNEYLPKNTIQKLSKSQLIHTTKQMVIRDQINVSRICQLIQPDAKALLQSL